MEAVRLGFPLDVTQAIREYASDRVGVHPTAVAWHEGVLFRQTYRSNMDAEVVWRILMDDVYSGGFCGEPFPHEIRFSVPLESV